MRVHVSFTGRILTFLWVLPIKEVFGYPTQMKAEKTKLEIPAIIANYWSAANASKSADAAACFTADAEAHDEGHCHRGTSAIRAWIEDTGRKYSPTVEPLHAQLAGDRALVTACVVGNFPGSPVELKYAFTLHAGLIAKLEIQ